MSVQRGEGEEWRFGPYDDEVSRWFTYFDDESLDGAVLDGGFELVAAWSNETWLSRVARKTQV